MTAVEGWTAAGFERVRDVFAKSFETDADPRELGASFAVYRGETLVVDLWGGHRDPERTVPWSRDTLVNIWSASKGVTAIAVALLVDRGQIDYAARVTDYWPEYGQNGKGETSVSQLLSHQAGLPGFTEPTTVEDLCDWQTAATRLAAQSPMWRPGEKSSYHALTFGFLAGELIRRVTGKSVGRFLASELTGPLAADVFIGLPESEDLRVAPLVASSAQPGMDIDPATLPPEVVAAMTNPSPDPAWPRSRAWRAAEIPAANAHATALGLARLYAVLANGGSFAGVDFLRPETIAALGAIQTTRDDLSLGGPSGWSHGMHSNLGGVFGPNSQAFGHVGWGGSFGSVDVQNRISIGYTVNKMGEGNTGDPRAAALTGAVYASL